MGNKPLSAWHVKLHVEGPGGPAHVIEHLRPHLYDHLVDRLITVHAPRVYSLILYVMADSKEAAEARAAMTVTAAIGRTPVPNLRVMHAEAAPAPISREPESIKLQDS